MKKVFKKNQIIITALALMIAVAGYLQYTGSQSDRELAKEASADTNESTYEISDEDMYSAEDIFTDTEDSAETSADAQGVQTGEQIANSQNADGENPGEAVLTSTNVSNVDFVSEVKLNREQIRSQNKASLMEVINNTNITEEQKQDAINAMISMTDIAEREAAAEMLLEAKGFTDVVVSITDSNADVVLNMGEVTDAKRAQVEDIVKRKTNVEAQNIVITPISSTATGENAGTGTEGTATEGTTGDGNEAGTGTEGTATEGTTGDGAATGTDGAAAGENQTAGQNE